MEKKLKRSGVFDPRASIRRAEHTQLSREINSGQYAGLNRIDRIRAGVPYYAIEEVSKRMNVPVKNILNKLGLPQTTYNKKKRENALLNGRDSEIILYLDELFDFGLQVFNGEHEKFHRWMQKANISLGGVSPHSLLDSITGIQEVKNCLNKLEYGNFS